MSPLLKGRWKTVKHGKRDNMQPFAPGVHGTVFLISATGDVEIWLYDAFNPEQPWEKVPNPCLVKEKNNTDYIFENNKPFYEVVEVSETELLLGIVDSRYNVSLSYYLCKRLPEKGSEKPLP